MDICPVFVLVHGLKVSVPTDFACCSKKPSDCNSRGLGQSGEQPVPEIPQHRAEDRHELADDCEERRPQGLGARRLQGLQEHHREVTGDCTAPKSHLTKP